MKNIFILPTEKPSRLQQFEGIDKIEFKLCSKESFFNKGFHIYITSDEDIKTVDWILHENSIYKVKANKGIYLSLEGLGHIDVKKDVCKKIILTTDQDLVKDGIQNVSDVFLMWYIKNLICEYVDVASELKAFDKNGFCISSAHFEDDYTKNIYYAVIPKVESKENPTTTVVREAMKIVSKDVRHPKYFRNKNRTIYNEDDLINFMQFIISQESLDNTSSVSKETARYYIEQFKNRQNEN